MYYLISASESFDEPVWFSRLYETRTVNTVIRENRQVDRTRAQLYVPLPTRPSF